MNDSFSLASFLAEYDAAVSPQYFLDVWPLPSAVLVLILAMATDLSLLVDKPLRPYMLPYCSFEKG